MLIRKARREEAGILTDLSMRSKAYWGYDDAFMAACTEALRVPEDAIEKYSTYVAEDGGRVAGYFMLIVEDDKGYLESLFVEPEYIGHGLGKLLWDELMEVAKEAGVYEFTIDADPHAEGFYIRMGAEKEGEKESSVFKGRMLPRLRMKISSQAY